MNRLFLQSAENASSNWRQTICRMQVFSATMKKKEQGVRRCLLDLNHQRIILLSISSDFLFLMTFGCKT